MKRGHSVFLRSASRDIQLERCPCDGIPLSGFPRTPASPCATRVSPRDGWNGVALGCYVTILPNLGTGSRIAVNQLVWKVMVRFNGVWGEDGSTIPIKRNVHIPPVQLKGVRGSIDSTCVLFGADVTATIVALPSPG